MEKPFDRSELLLGADALERLRRAKVVIFGIGGVGGYAAEALVRSGIGRLVLVDHDRISLTNLNRQIIALHSTLGIKWTLCGSGRWTSIRKRRWRPDAVFFCLKMNGNSIFQTVITWWTPWIR